MKKHMLSCLVLAPMGAVTGGVEEEERHNCGRGQDLRLHCDWQKQSPATTAEPILKGGLLTACCKHACTPRHTCINKHWCACGQTDKKQKYTPQFTRKKLYPSSKTEPMWDDSTGGQMHISFLSLQPFLVVHNTEQCRADSPAPERNKWIHSKSTCRL